MPPGAASGAEDCRGGEKYATARIAGASEWVRLKAMISKVHLFGAALAGILVCSLAGAQARSTAVAPARRSFSHTGPTGRASANSAPSAATGFQSTLQPSLIQIPPSGRVGPGFAPAGSLFAFGSPSGSPGLGFDFAHRAGIGGARRNNSGQFEHHGHRGQGFYAPIFFGAYPNVYDDEGYDPQDGQAEQQVQESQPRPQANVIQQPAPAEQGAGSDADSRNLSSSDSGPQPAAAIPDVGNFIFVRRDGSVLFASMFSVVGPQLQYVTPEGIRRTMAISDLDSDATQQMNEARGTTVQIHK
jgi:hypothetical protein